MKKIFEFFGWAFFVGATACFVIGVPSSLLSHFYFTLGASVLLLGIMWIQFRWQQGSSTLPFFYGLLLAALVARFLRDVLGRCYIALQTGNPLLAPDLYILTCTISFLGALLIGYILYFQAYRTFDTWSEERRLDS